MKRLLKIVALCLIFCMTVAMSACAPSAKTFTKLEMSIELNTDFVEKTIISQTVYYESKDVIVTALREPFTLLSGTENWSVSKYGQTCITANALTGCTAQLSQDGTYAYFTYTKELNGVEYTYLATCHKADEAFWLIQFATFSSKYESVKTQLFEYAESIQFASAQ
ncbi:MAG: hypothetical protein IKD20_04360 [Clostridia bacterium]|nr:hypothetical protein [Clostridia bacterium]